MGHLLAVAALALTAALLAGGCSSGAKPCPPASTCSQPTCPGGCVVDLAVDQGVYLCDPTSETDTSSCGVCASCSPLLPPA